MLKNSANPPLRAFAALVLAFCAIGVTAAKADSWGAIAVDLSEMSQDPFYGIGGGDSEKEATDTAVKFCKEAGGKGCKLAVSYNQCGAYAASKTTGGWGRSSTKEGAEKQSIEGCKDAQCKVVVSDCN